MNREISPEQLDHGVQMLMEGRSQSSGERDSLLEIGADLRVLPSQKFRQQLREDLLAQAEAIDSVPQVANTDFPQLGSQPMPTLTERPFSVLPADPRSLLFSFLSHAAAVVLIASGIWISRSPIVKTTRLMRDLTYVPMPLGQDAPHGGGAGGDRNTVQVSRGAPPKFSNVQVTPPAIVVRNPSPKLQVDPTVLGPPQIRLPQSNQLGELTSSNVVLPSNGTGGRGGMGSSLGTGIGDGSGAGVGPGDEAGIGGGLFRPGIGVSSPQAIYDPDPEYSDEARRAKYQGTVVLSLIVDPSGHARNIRIARSLGMGLDEKAMEAVQKWRFAPGMRDGHAVAVQVNVEVNFRLY